MLKICETGLRHKNRPLLHTLSSSDPMDAGPKPMTEQKLTPREVNFDLTKLPTYKGRRQKTSFDGCTQVYQVFIKSDGKISCSCMRYYNILEHADNVNVAEWYNGQVMEYIRESFEDGLEPFSFCSGCESRVADMDVRTAAKYVTLHIEPSSQCNLFCSACTCTNERLSSNPPTRANLKFETFKKVAYDFHGSEQVVGGFAFVGYGEPLFNSEVPKMVRLARDLFPHSSIYLDTNCNFGPKRAIEIADCGFSEIRMALDGSNQEAYVQYRESGNFKKAFAFASVLANEVRKRKSSTKLVWKYILFRHNDSDEEILQAVDMAESIGVEIQFDATYGSLASPRSLNEIRALAGKRARTGTTVDPAAYDEDRPDIDLSGQALNYGRSKKGELLRKFRNAVPYLYAMLRPRA
ncbi:radical SAM protein [Methylobacterium sp. E-066]|uniref:radical SAM protein n=1 Tax=Methylobacterium sp. E-066 TaxID=2836584 RepID=UPI001FB9F1F9|nr:radical SAM protein [Methylobacterium sp. E-066]MCJ2142943.1 radical SAM protein [Methylobacterium sp. E-066]